MIRKTIFISLLFLSVFACRNEYQLRQIPASIAQEIESDLKQNILSSWYPKCIDSVYGGYLSSFSSEFEVTENQNKMIVTQARHMWTNSKAYLRYLEPEYLQFAAHGFDFLENKMWDKEFGGFFQLVDRSGTPIDPDLAIKTAYGNAFGIYGLSAYFATSRDSAALELARKTFYWLEDNSHDPEYLGYFQHLRREGGVIIRSDTVPSTSDIGYKDQNSSIHLLEAFTELYKVWPDSLVRKRLTEMFYLVRDRIVNKNYFMNLFFTPDWTPVLSSDRSRDQIMAHIYLDHVSFGHDIETTYLLLEASEVLGIEHENTLKKTRKMVDHVLAFGWDSERGGIYDGAFYFNEDPVPEIILETKSWWSQAEALNTLLLFHSFYPDEEYDSLFFVQWKYIKDNLIDRDHGGWYVNGLDTDPEAKDRLKGQIWKSTYHNYRALANCLDMLKEHGINLEER